MKKLSKVGVMQLQESIDLAFDVIEDLVQHPEKLDSLPDHATLIPMPVKTAPQPR